MEFQESRVFKEGDIISVLIVVLLLNGFHGDAARTFPVGKVSEEARKLIEVTEESFFKGIEKAKVGNRLTDISYAIQKYVEAHGFSVVRDYVGHGIGRRFMKIQKFLISEDQVEDLSLKQVWF